MDTRQMRHFLRMDECTNGVWRGFVAVDSEPLDPISSTDDLYMINTDHSDGPGKHWCVGYADAGTGEMEFFDSYGLAPHAYGLERLFPDGYRIRMNGRTVQQLDSFTCGYHCLFFAYYRSRGVAMDTITGTLYSANLRWNDRMVSNFVQQYGKVFTLDPHALLRG
jgi:hypothetical protein